MLTNVKVRKNKWVKKAYYSEQSYGITIDAWDWDVAGDLCANANGDVFELK